MWLIGHQDWIHALIGGLIIGIAASLMLFWNGRVTGVSGILNGTLDKKKGEFAWRLLFIAGLFLGGLTLNFFDPTLLNPALLPKNQIASSFQISWWPTLFAGLFVGFGAVMANGCTSGHGVCGISRLSPRSLVATLSFIGAGALVVLFLRATGVFQ